MSNAAKGAVAVFMALVTGGCESSTAPQDYTVAGIVMDSVLNRPAAGLEIKLSGGRSVDTDARGYYEIRLEPGMHVLEVDHFKYRLLTRALNVAQDTVVSLNVVRRGPWVSAVRFESGYITVTVGDADGATDLPEEMQATFFYNGVEANGSTRSSTRSSYVGAGYRIYQFYPTSQSSITTIVIVPRDAAGNWTPVVCRKINNWVCEIS